MTTASSARPATATTGGRLPAWFVPAMAAAAVVAAYGLSRVTSISGTAGTLVVAGLIFLTGATELSALVEGRRRATDRFVAHLVWLMFLLALAPLASVAVTVGGKGIARFDADFFTHSLNGVGPFDLNGGAYHAIIGTLEQVGIATLLCVPVGMLAAVYVVEYGRGPLATAIRFFVDVMTGIPSIVAGLFVLSFWVLGLGFGFSGLAAALSLVVLMLPTVIRSTEEMLRLVPDALREGSYALGVPQWRTIVRVVLPTALPGIITGIMLGIARVTGETAPVLLTAGGNPAINGDPFSGRQASLALMVFQEAGSSARGALPRAWTAALTLILVVLTLNLFARLLTRRSRLAH